IAGGVRTSSPPSYRPRAESLAETAPAPTAERARKLERVTARRMARLVRSRLSSIPGWEVGGGVVGVWLRLVAGVGLSRRLSGDAADGSSSVENSQPVTTTPSSTASVPEEATTTTAAAAEPEPTTLTDEHVEAALKAGALAV